MRNFFYGSGGLCVQRNNGRLFELAPNLVVAVNLPNQNEHEREHDDDSKERDESASHEHGESNNKAMNK